MCHQGNCCFVGITEQQLNILINLVLVFLNTLNLLGLRKRKASTAKATKLPSACQSVLLGHQGQLVLFWLKEGKDELISERLRWFPPICPWHLFRPSWKWTKTWQVGRSWLLFLPAQTEEQLWNEYCGFYTEKTWSSSTEHSYDSCWRLFYCFEYLASYCRLC